MEDNKDIKDTVVDNTTGTIVNTENASKEDAKPVVKKSKPVGRPKKVAKKSLIIDLTKYGHNVLYAIAHAKLEAGIELQDIEKDALEEEKKLMSKSESLFTKVGKSFKTLKNKISNWIKK